MATSYWKQKYDISCFVVLFCLTSCYNNNYSFQFETHLYHDDEQINDNAVPYQGWTTQTILHPVQEAFRPGSPLSFHPLLTMLMAVIITKVGLYFISQQFTKSSFIRINGFTHAFLSLGRIKTILLIKTRAKLGAFTAIYVSFSSRVKFCCERMRGQRSALCMPLSIGCFFFYYLFSRPPKWIITIPVSLLPLQGPKFVIYKNHMGINTLKSNVTVGCIQWRSQGLSRWASRPPGEPK